MKYLDICELCGAQGPDHRTLALRYFYEITEMVPEMDSYLEKSRVRVYTLRTCKHCRGMFLGMLQEWRSACLARRPVTKDADGDDLHGDPRANIPVRVHGTVAMMTPEQYEEYRRQG